MREEKDIWDAEQIKLISKPLAHDAMGRPRDEESSWRTWAAISPGLETPQGGCLLVVDSGRVGSMQNG